MFCKHPLINDFNLDFLFFLLNCRRRHVNAIMHSMNQVSASGKAILITGCESPLAWCLARKLDELGFTIFAGFTKRSGCADADLLKEESSGRTKILQLDVTSETQVNHSEYEKKCSRMEHTCIHAPP